MTPGSARKTTVFVLVEARTTPDILGVIHASRCIAARHQISPKLGNHTGKRTPTRISFIRISSGRFVQSLILDERLHSVHLL